HATFGYRDDLFDGKTLIHINISAGEIDKSYKADCAIVADAKLAMTALLKAMDGVPRPPPADVDSCTKEMTHHLLHLTGHIHPGQMAQAISRLAPKDAIILPDAGCHLVWMGFFLQLDETQPFRKP